MSWILAMRIVVMFFMDWILQVKSVFEYKNYGDPKYVLTETKQKKGVMHWWRNLYQQRHGLQKNPILA